MTGCCFLLLADADGNEDINSKLLTWVADQGPVGTENNLPFNYIQISSLRRRPQRHSVTIFSSVHLSQASLALPPTCAVISWPHLSSLHPRTSSSSWPPLALLQVCPVSTPHLYGSHSDSQSSCCVLSLYQPLVGPVFYSASSICPSLPFVFICRLGENGSFVLDNQISWLISTFSRSAF